MSLLKTPFLFWNKSEIDFSNLNERFLGLKRHNFSGKQRNETITSSGIVLLYLEKNRTFRIKFRRSVSPDLSNLKVLPPPSPGDFYFSLRYQVDLVHLDSNYNPLDLILWSKVNLNRFHQKINPRCNLRIPSCGCWSPGKQRESVV